MSDCKHVIRYEGDGNFVCRECLEPYFAEHVADVSNSRQEHIEALELRATTLEHRCDMREQRIRMIFSAWFREYDRYKEFGFNELADGLEQSIINLFNKEQP